MKAEISYIVFIYTSKGVKNMSGSIIASEIVRDYKIEQFYKNRNRNKGDKNNEKMDKTKCRRIHKEM